MTDPTPHADGAPTTGESAGGVPRTEPGSDLPTAGADELQEVGEEVAAARAEAVAAEAGGAGANEAGTNEAGANEADKTEADMTEADMTEADTMAGGADEQLAQALGLAGQRLEDLLRERAEFVNYRRRVERDREVAGVEARTGVLSALLPVLDDIDGARTHGDLVGPFAAVSEKLDGVLRRLGLEPFGEVGDAFDPALHEALLQDDATQVDQPTCTQVLQRGYRSGDRVLRPARVAVASPS